MALLVTGEEDAERRVRLPPNVDSFALGSGGGMTIGWPRVARKHAILVRQDRQWWLRHRAPTWLNGETVTDRCALRSEDVIRLGVPRRPPITFRDASTPMFDEFMKRTMPDAADGG